MQRGEIPTCAGMTYPLIELVEIRVWTSSTNRRLASQSFDKLDQRTQPPLTVGRRSSSGGSHEAGSAGT